MRIRSVTFNHIARNAPCFDVIFHAYHRLGLLNLEVTRSGKK